MLLYNEIYGGKDGRKEGQILIQKDLTGYWPDLMPITITVSSRNYTVSIEFGFNLL